MWNIEYEREDEGEDRGGKRARFKGGGMRCRHEGSVGVMSMMSDGDCLCEWSFEVMVCGYVWYLKTHEQL
jgi:hypothetical protein